MQPEIGTDYIYFESPLSSMNVDECTIKLHMHSKNPESMSNVSVPFYVDKSTNKQNLQEDEYKNEDEAKTIEHIHVNPKVEIKEDSINLIQ